MILQSALTLNGEISYKKTNSNTDVAYVYVQTIKNCILLQNASLSTLSSNPKNIIQYLGNTYQKLLATAVSSDCVKAFEIQDASVVKKNGIQMMKLKISNKQLHSTGDYAKNAIMISDDDNAFKPASLTITQINSFHPCILNNPPWCYRADLEGADLSGLYLGNANLTLANLTGATLTGAILTDATMVSANLSGANLTNANLSGANLFLADMVQANLQGANLQGANLQGANLQGANLQGADLRGARNLDRALNANLTGAILR